mmetsp:Transcript_10709/g.43331  ORF Transcript_10709/g.43331 Transcript_10709/m.43331 type:complete len:298 (-) Transcript_10709:385-1278(-)
MTAEARERDAPCCCCCCCCTRSQYQQRGHAELVVSSLSPRTPHFGAAVVRVRCSGNRRPTDPRFHGLDRPNARGQRACSFSDPGFVYLPKTRVTHSYSLTTPHPDDDSKVKSRGASRSAAVKTGRVSARDDVPEWWEMRFSDDGDAVVDDALSPIARLALGAAFRVAGAVDLVVVVVGDRGRDVECVGDGDHLGAAKVVVGILLVEAREALVAPRLAPRAGERREVDFARARCADAVGGRHRSQRRRGARRADTLRESPASSHDDDAAADGEAAEPEDGGRADEGAERERFEEALRL